MESRFFCVSTDIPHISRVSSGAYAQKASADAFLEKKLIKKLYLIKRKVLCPAFFQKK